MSRKIVEKVTAKRDEEDVFLVEIMGVVPGWGIVVDLEEGIEYPGGLVASVLLRGYWDCDISKEEEEKARERVQKFLNEKEEREE